jgi:hypothetical protein
MLIKKKVTITSKSIILEKKDKLEPNLFNSLFGAVTQYAGSTEAQKADMASSHQVKRFFQAFSYTWVFPRALATPFSLSPEDHPAGCDRTMHRYDGYGH